MRITLSVLLLIVLLQGCASSGGSSGGGVDAFLGSYLIPFQIVGVLLSVALIGGVMLARERTKEETHS